LPPKKNSFRRVFWDEKKFFRPVENFSIRKFPPKKPAEARMTVFGANSLQVATFIPIELFRPDFHAFLLVL
jgi:hypothetical protein